MAIDIVPLLLREFDAILGTDWLSLHRAHIDCSNKEMTLYTMGDEEVFFLGERKILSSSIISTLTSTKMLRRGCEVFLAHVVSIESNVSNLANIPVVRRFSNVFLKDLPGFSSVKELEFGIDLVVDSKSISRAPYRIAPTELKELKTQL